MLYIAQLWSASVPKTDWLLSLQSMDSSDLSDGAVTLQEYLELKKALATSEAKVQQLMKVNSSLSDELRRLQREIHKLQAENLQLRQPPGPVPPPSLPSERAEHTLMGPGGSTHRRDRQAFSMYEPGSALKPFGGTPGDELATRLQPFHSTVSSLLALVGEMRVTLTLTLPCSLRSSKTMPSTQCMSLPAFIG
jgi:hypothetical protein